MEKFKLSGENDLQFSLYTFLIMNLLLQYFWNEMQTSVYTVLKIKNTFLGQFRALQKWSSSPQPITFQGAGKGAF